MPPGAATGVHECNWPSFFLIPVTISVIGIRYDQSLDTFVILAHLERKTIFKKFVLRVGVI